MQDKPKTARFGTTLFLDNPLHRQAWEILSAIPAGQRTNWLCLALCQQAQREQFLLDLKTILQTELQNSSYPQTISRPQPAGSVDDDVLGFDSIDFNKTSPEGTPFEILTQLRAMHFGADTFDGMEGHIRYMQNMIRRMTETPCELPESSTEERAAALIHVLQEIGALELLEE